MAPSQIRTLPVLPLARGNILLPGVAQRIPVTAARPDIPAILASVYTRAASAALNERIDAVPIACVPVSSPFVGPNGQLLIQDADQLDDSLIKDIDPGTAGKADLFNYGVAARITGIEARGTADFALRVEGIARIRVERVTQERPHIQAKVKYFYDQVSTDSQVQELFSLLKSRSRELLSILRISALLPNSLDSPGGLSPVLFRRLDMFINKKELEDAGQLADFMANLIEASYEEKLEVLAAFDVKVRLAKVIELLDRQVSGIKNNVNITTITSVPVQFLDKISDRISRVRPNGTLPPPNSMFPPGPNGAISRNPDDNQEPNELEELGKKLHAANLPPEIAKAAERDLRRLKKMTPGNQEYQVTRTWLDVLSEIPWSVATDDRLGPDTITRARKQLDDDHHGLDKVKKRLVEYLAVLRLKQSINDDVNEQINKVEQEVAPHVSEKQQDAENGKANNTELEERTKLAYKKIEVLRSKRMPDRSPIMLFVGPPGVGKTSLAKSIATALGRKFHRISLGGIRDEAEIRGHRRTYVAAMPGLIIQGLRKAGVSNPVFLLDEIDKLGMSNQQGDPSAAMLEVLDPEQNNSFTDHYVGLPVDLSRVLFIATANSLDTIPAPLLDRMETIYLPGYTTLEKRYIAMQYLVPKQVRVHGLSEDQVSFDTEVVSKIIESYTRESGVRNLEREIGSVCRAKAVEFAEAKDGGQLETYRPQLSVEDIEEILGIEKFQDEIAEKTSKPGIVTGLVAYSSGGNGSILFIEVADMPGNGSVQLTGKLGDVLKESVEVALSWVKAHAYGLGLTSEPSANIMKERSIHVHCPSASVPKDGPSSGMAQAIALISLFSNKPVPPTMAMTGEISLRGRVTAVGGIKEKLIGALRAGVKTVLLPAQNRKDVKDLPQEVKNGLEIIYVNHVWEAIRLIWPDCQWPGAVPFPPIESRL